MSSKAQSCSWDSLFKCCTATRLDQGERKVKESPFFAVARTCSIFQPIKVLSHREKEDKERGREICIITPNDNTLTVSSFEYMLARCRAEYCSRLVASGLDLEQETQLHRHTPTLPASSNFRLNNSKWSIKKCFDSPKLYHPLQRVDLVLHGRVHQGRVTRHLADREFLSSS